MGFAENLGVIINLKDSTSETDVEYHKWLIESVDNRCFEPAIPRMGALQDAARYRTLDRSYAAKYPGAAGQSIRAVASELLRRLDTAKAAATGASLPPVVQPAPAAKPAVSSAGVAPAQPAAPQTTAAAAAARPVAMAAPAAPAASTAPNPPATATAKLASTPPAPPPPAASLAAAVAAVSASVPAKPATSPDKSELGAPFIHTPLRAWGAPPPPPRHYRKRKSPRRGEGLFSARGRFLRALISMARRCHQPLRTGLSASRT